MFHNNALYLPCGSKIQLLYLLWFSRYLRFFIFRQNSRWPPKGFSGFNIILYCCESKIRSKLILLHCGSKICSIFVNFVFCKKLAKGSNKESKNVETAHPHYWKIFEKLEIVLCSDPMRIKKFVEIALSCTVKEI